MPDGGRRRRTPDEPCLNCGDTTPGNYCPTCGQRKTEVLVSVRTMLADVLEDQLVLNRALPRTIGALLFRPGFLTSEYVRGRIVRYIAPFRLYLVASVLFFLVLSFVGMDQGPTITIDGEVASVEEALEAAGTSLTTLQMIDTVGLSAEDRAAVRSALARADSALQSGDSAAAQGAAREDDFVPGRPEHLQDWARTVEINSPWPWVTRALERKLIQVGHLPPGEAMRVVLGDMLEFAPHMVFLLLPLFAALLKLLYIRRSRYYAEHFVFALHVHAFVFVNFLLMFIFPWDWIDAILLLWMMLYVWLAMRHVYQQGWFRTTAKWWVLGWSYMFVFSVGIAGLSIATLLFT